MATGGFDHSIAGGHDIVPDWPCAQCEEAGSVTEATAYCRNCDEAYCKSCIKLHNRLAKGHEVLLEDRGDWGKPIVDQRVVDDSTLVDSGVKCSEHEGEKINMYCGHHDDVCCPVCAVMNHSDICKPKMSYIPHAAKSVASSPEFQDFIAKNDRLITRITQIENEKEESISELDSSRKAYKSVVEEIDDELRGRVENLKVNTLSEIDALHDEEILKITDASNKCKEMRSDLHDLQKQLQPSRPVNEASLFVTLKMNKKKLKSYTQLCDNLKNMKQKSFAFQQDQAILQLQQITSFGKFGVKQAKHGKEKGTKATDDNGKGIDSVCSETEPDFTNLQSHRFHWSRDAANIKAYKTNEGLDVYVYNASIIRVPVDCIVNASNGMLQHEVGLARVIQDEAGYELTRESDDYIKRKGNIPVGMCCSTTAGRLPYRRVIHTIGPRWYDYHPHTLEKVQECEERLYMAIMNTLYQAGREGMQSVAIPAISAAIFGVPEEICTYQYAKATVDYIRREAQTAQSMLKEVHFVDINVKIVKQIQERFDAFITEGTVPTYNILKYVKSSLLESYRS